MILKNLMGIMLFTVLLFLMFFIVPRRRVKDFFMIGLTGGLVVAVLLVTVMQNWLGLWRFHQVDFWVPWGIPLFLSAAWFPLEIIYSHLLSQFRKPFMITVLTILLPLGAILVHYFLLNNGMLFYHHWTLFLTFLVSLAIHLCIGYYLYITGRLGNRMSSLKVR